MVAGEGGDIFVQGTSRVPRWIWQIDVGWVLWKPINVSLDDEKNCKKFRYTMTSTSVKICLKTRLQYMRFFWFQLIWPKEPI